MKILRLSTFLIITMMLVPIDSSAHCKPNHPVHGAHCDDPPEPPDPGGGDGLLRVNVTFRDDVDDRAPNLPTDGLQSILGTYDHKQGKVSASIGEGFALKLTKGKQPAIRTLFLDFTCVYDPEGDCNPPFQIANSPDSSGESVGLLTINASGVDLLAMGLGDDNSSSSLRLALNLDLDLIGGGVWILVFDDDGFGICPEGDTINTDIDVTRTSPVEWVIEATSDDVACLVKNDQGAFDLIFSGLYSMPFKMRVKKQL